MAAENVSVAQAPTKPALKPFTTIEYVTKDGEKCTATKNNGIVTVQGDKNGVRQVPVDQFMQELAATLPKVDLARTPNKDTVQFKGGEEKTLEDTAPNHKARNWAIGIGTTVATLIGLGIAGRNGHLGKGIQKLLGGAEKDAGKLADDLTGAAGHTNPHATTETSEISAQEFEQIVNREADFVYGGSKKTEQAVENVASEVHAPEIKPEAKVETRAPETTSVPKETVKPNETAAKPQETKSTPKFEDRFRPTTHLSPEEIVTLPKDLEIDPAKVLQLGSKDQYGNIRVRTPDNIERVYKLTSGENPKIEVVLDYTPGQIAPFRNIEFKDGVPHAIRDNTTNATHVNFLPKPKTSSAQPKVTQAPKQEAPKPTQTPKQEAAQPQKTPEQLKKEEIARQQQIEDDLAKQQQEAERLRRQQEDTINNDIINTAVIADMMSTAGRKTAEKAGESVSKGVDKMAEQMAKEADRAAETVAKADVPKAGTVIEEAVPTAGKIEAPAYETVANNGEKVADDLFAQKPTDGLYTPKTGEELYTPGDGYLTSTEKVADDIVPESSRTSFLDDTVDEFGLPKSTLDDVAEFETSSPSFLDDTVDEFGMPKFNSLEDDIARFDEPNPMDDITSSFDDGFGDFFG